MSYKVICINEDWRDRQPGTDSEPTPVFGERCEAIGEWQNWRGTVYYTLSGYPQHLEYNSKHFAGISDIDERDLVAERETQTQPA